MFINPEMAETTGISEIGISFADDFPPSFVIKTIDFDSFLDGASGIEGVTELSTKISFSSILDFLESSILSSFVRGFFQIRLTSKYSLKNTFQ